MRDTSLHHLSREFLPLALELLATLVERGILVKIIQTWRTDEEHAEDVAAGRSWTKVSKHQRTEGGLPASDAIDICPYFEWRKNGEDKLDWDDTDPVWVQIGAIGKKLGLRWGGDFQPPAKPDLGHFEYRREVAETTEPSVG